MAARFKTRIGIAVSTAAVVLSLTASVALAGEVTGPPGSIGHPGAKKDMSHPNSICASPG